MRFLLTVVVAIAFCLGLKAQLIDSFSDGNFTSNPSWDGTRQLFRVNSTQALQLNDTAAGTAFLYTAQNRITNTQWEILVNMNFAPSLSNFARIYLASDRTDLSSALNGYYLQLGENGSADAIVLYRQNSVFKTQLGRGHDGLISGKSNHIRIRVTCSQSGDWTVWTDTAGNRNFAQDFTAFDNRFIATNYFGLFCEYTVSNSKNFYFDEVSVIPFERDSIPPGLNSFTVSSPSTLSLGFSEPIDPRVTNLPCFLVDSGKVTPNVKMISDDSIQLSFSNPLNADTLHQLKIIGLPDLAGNRLFLDTSFEIHKNSKTGSPKFLLSEILPDPSPSIGLPDAEFIELYNNGATGNLKNWKIMDGSHIAKTLPDAIIDSAGYVILCSLTDTSAFRSFGKVVGVASMPDLNNDADNLWLIDDRGLISDKMEYDASTFESETKAQGGWSLERINFNSTCVDENWTASKSLIGGSPGKENSVIGKTVIPKPIELISVVANDSSTIELEFTTGLDSEIFSKPGIINISDGFRCKEVIPADDFSLKTMGLKLSKPMKAGEIYSLSIPALKSCSGISFGPFTAKFGLPELLDSFDVNINEILSNPLTGGSDFVELYNRTNKVIALSDLTIATLDETGTIHDPVKISTRKRLFLPGAYIVVSEDTKFIESHYRSGDLGSMINLPIPGLPDDTGVVVIFNNKTGQIIDQVCYSKSWHNKLLANDDGVSLEKLNPGLKSQSGASWTSASSISGFATPGLLNSEFLPFSDAKNAGSIRLEKDVFSPDGDGFEDELILDYEFPSEGMAATVTIYDAAGAIVKKVADNQTLNTKGILKWDGNDENGEKAPIGIYILVFSGYNAKGEQVAWKTGLTLAARMK